MVRLRVGEWGPCQPTSRPVQKDRLDPPKVEDNSIFFESDHKDATFPEVGEAEGLDEKSHNADLTSDLRYTTLRGDPKSPLKKENEGRQNVEDDLPEVGRLERDLSCVHVNGTRLPLR